MTDRTTNLQLMAAWLKATPAPCRWHAYQAQISHHVVATDAFCWTNRSPVHFGDRASPIIASAPAPAAR